LRLFTWIIMVPVALAVISFAVNNREGVGIDLWPAPYTLDVPVFAIVLISVVIGMMVGAIVAWFGGGKSRGRARAEARRATSAEREAADLRERMTSEEPAEPNDLKALPGRVDAK
jgi:lipopolysaccharide assembly protein A